MLSFDDGDRYSFGHSLFSPPHSDQVQALSLGVATSKRVVIPTGANYVNFSGTGDFYMQFGTGSVTAAIPADTADGTASVLNPGTRRIPRTATNVACISAAAQVVTMEFWS
jgi:hypothetical protein